MAKPVQFQREDTPSQSTSLESEAIGFQLARSIKVTHWDFITVTNLMEWLRNLYSSANPRAYGWRLVSHCLVEIQEKVLQGLLHQHLFSVHEILSKDLIYF
jgi:hypothetical protein